MKLKATEPVKPLNEGSYTGKIEKVEFRKDPYEYTDFFVSVDGTDRVIKYGVPTKMSAETSLGKLYALHMGVEIKGGKDYDPEDLIGKKVKYMVVNEPGKGKNSNMEFSRIVEGSLKPIK